MSGWQETEYGRAPSEWQILTIGELSKKVTDGAHFSPRPQTAGKYMCSVKDMSYNRFVFSDCKLISEEDFEKLSTQGCRPEKGDILISKDGANCLDLIFVFNQNEELVLLSSIAIVRLLPIYEPTFVRYFLLSPACQFTMRNNYVSGSAIPRVVLKDFKKVPVLIPSLPEQKAIAAVLSSLDDKIDLLHRQNLTLEAMAETLFRQWFIEEAQEDWEKVTIGDFVEINRASMDKNYPHKTIDYLDTGSLTSGIIEGFQSFTLDKAPSRAKRLVQHNDVLISTVRPDQRHYGIIKNPIENLVVSTGFCVLTCTKIDPHFIYLLLTNNEMTDYLHTIAEGSTSTYPSLKPSDIGSIVFQLPPVDKLKEFSILAKNLWEKIERNHIQIRTLEKLRDTLLPKLMSGEVRVAL
jgi:type I restriction enzyme S subunit